MANKIRLGFVGANVRLELGLPVALPGAAGSPDVELTAVCTTRPESAEEAREAFGAKLAFHDFRAMVASPEIDAVAVVVRVPSHYEPTRAAIEAGKHVYTEWPLGRTAAEAEELAALARAKVQTAVGLQARGPALLYMKEQIEAGYVGEVLSCHATAMRDGALELQSHLAARCQPRREHLTIANGHAIDALRFVGQLRAGGVHGHDAVPVNGTRPTRSSWWRSPRRTMLVSGQLASGAVASVHVAAVPWAGSGFRMEIYGREGTLVTTGNVSSQRGEMLRLQGARGSHELSELAIPERFVHVPADFLAAIRSTSGRAACRRSTPRLTCTTSSIRSSRRRIRAGSSPVT